jgi:peptidoglycan/LPS O-acetylase OafA/YrhL
LNPPNIPRLGKPDKIYEIEALRGVCVIAVIIHHLNTEYLPGGYLGVDVFFVISGFVISDSLNKLKFNSNYEYFLIFYTRRIRRLFPALFVFVVTTTAVSWFFVDGFSSRIINTGASALLGLSNLYQIRIGNDYFGLASNYNLFTHTWSLGVEEQFYLVFPLIYLFKRVRLYSTTYLILLLLMSFLTFSTFGYFSEINLQYYLPISRFWEILTGAVTYLITKNASPYKYSNKKKWQMHFYTLSLIACFFIPSDYLVYSAPTICIVTGLFLHGVATHHYKYIQTRFLLFTGKISYSLYLYHLPILIIFKLEPSVVSILAQFIFLYLVSFLSYILIEKPFRLSETSSKGISTVYSFIFFSVSAALLLYAVSKNTGTRDPFSPPIEKDFRTCFYKNITEGECFPKSGQNRQLFFVGDSHSRALLPLMLMLNDKLDFRVYSIGVDGLYTTKFTSNSHGNLKEKGETFLKFLENNGERGDSIILTNQLMTWFSKTYNDKLESHRLFLNGARLEQDQALKIHTQDLDQLAKKIDGIGMSLIVIAPFPDFKYPPSTCYSPILMKYFKNLRFPEKCQTTRREQEARRNHILKTLVNLSSENRNVFLFDPINFICTPNICSNIREGTPLYYDDDHINFNTAKDMYLEFKETLDLSRN